ncbi:MAG: hypothetical protein ACXW1Z_23275 [Methylobacter sp.]
MNDYEGISGYEEFWGDLALMYFVTLDLATGKLVGLSMTPLQIKRFRLNYALPDDVHWLQQVMNRESRLQPRDKIAQCADSQDNSVTRIRLCPR